MRMLIVKRTLEIIAICLAIAALLLLRRPPRVGNAALSEVEENLLQQEQVPNEWAFSPVEIQDETVQEEAEFSLVDVPETAFVEETPAEKPLKYVDIIEKRQITERADPASTAGIVDARNCFGLNYDQVMRGEVSTRMVWNGRTFVSQKVCVVQERKGVASIWSFEQTRKAVISEMPTNSTIPRDASTN